MLLFHRLSSKMKQFLYLVSLCLPMLCMAQNTTQNKAITLEETRELLFTLADDDMKGRDSKSGGYERSAEYAIGYLKKHKVRPFYPAYRDSLYTDSLLSYNVVGQIGSFLPQRKTVVIGAHLDHIGIQTQAGDSIFNGANDNASGVVAVLQISRYLAQFSWDKNLLVALFADEEKGLKGAYHLAERMKNEGVDLAFMLNFEMLGKTLTNGPKKVYMTGFNNSNMAEVMNAIDPDFVQFFPRAEELNLFRRSDNYAFYQQFGVAAQTLSTFDFQNYDHYHKASDEAEKMDIENMQQVIERAAKIVAIMLRDSKEIQLNQKGKTIQ